MTAVEPTPLIAVACGGTGGHLFPGLAIAEVLQQWGCDIALLVSQKDVDQEAVKSALAKHVICLPAVGLQDGQWSHFLQGFSRSYWLCRRSFRQLRPRAVLAMGGFTSAPPVLAAKTGQAATFLHESNSIPGRANRWLAPWVDQVFVGFPGAARRLSSQSVRCLGTPARSQFRAGEPGPCRMALGLDPRKPVLLVMGGSQGASGINKLLTEALPLLTLQAPDLQFIHLTGATDYQTVHAAYGAQKRRASVRPFLTEMELALGAATLAVSRAGASSLAEFGATHLPAILIPYPYATDNHQWHNADAVARTGAARVLVQASATPESVAREVILLLESFSARAAMQRALEQWHFPNSAAEIAGQIFNHLGLPKPNLPAEEPELEMVPSPNLTRRPWAPQPLEIQAALMHAR
jgi:UDP-N-acetylglucosamine--N-acetylmuramyl-(pentapeptide) pyrophosphoryl-undecaprenol N-acetylglucosamine transferase